MIESKRSYRGHRFPPDQDGDTIDILVQSRRDSRAGKRFFRKLLKSQGQGPNR